MAIKLATGVSNRVMMEVGQDVPATGYKALNTWVGDFILLEVWGSWSVYLRCHRPDLGLRESQIIAGPFADKEEGIAVFVTLTRMHDGLKDDLTTGEQDGI